VGQTPQTVEIAVDDLGQKDNMLVLVAG
jgi:hypothetical protein